jgi:homoserine dehydrogenase
MAKSEWRIGVAGLGTVGGGLIQFLEARPDFAPAGASARVVGVTARSRSRPRPSARRRRRSRRRSRVASQS